MEESDLRRRTDGADFVISHRGDYHHTRVVLTESEVTGNIPPEACVDSVDNWYVNIPGTAIGPCPLLVDGVTVTRRVISISTTTTGISSSSSSSSTTTYLTCLTLRSNGYGMTMTIITMRDMQINATVGLVLAQRVAALAVRISSDGKLVSTYIVRMSRETDMTVVPAWWPVTC